MLLTPAAAWRRLSVATALAVLVAQPAVGQSVLSPSALYAAEAGAITESVPVRPRPDYQPLGILIGDLLSFPGGATDGTATLTPLPTPAPVTRRTLRPLDSATGSTGQVTASRGSSGSGVADVLGSFTLRPRVTVEGTYNDNIFRTDAFKRDDFITVIRPSLRLLSDWNNHALNLEASGAIGRYADFSVEDYDDYLFSVAPRIDITDENNVNLSLRHSRVHEERSGSELPVQGDDLYWDAEVAWTYSGPALSSISRYAFRRRDALDNGLVSRDTFDSDVHTAQWRLGWKFSPGRTAWVQPEYQVAEFHTVDPVSGFDRDNSGVVVLAGLTFDVSDVSFLEFGVGVVTRTFDEPTKGDLADFAYRLRAVWNVSPLITLDLAAGRSVNVDDSFAALATIDDEVVLKGAWDPLERLILSASLGYRKTDFISLPGFERDESSLDGSLNLRYLVGQNAFLEADYKFVSFKSSRAVDVYDSNQVTLRAGMEL